VLAAALKFLHDIGLPFSMLAQDVYAELLHFEHTDINRSEMRAYPLIIVELAFSYFDL
jgi:HD superfamily phosphohydrolase